MSQVVQGDYAQPATLDIAFSDIDVALIVSGYAKPGERALLHKNAIDARSSCWCPASGLSLISRSITTVKIPDVARPLPN